MFELEKKSVILERRHLCWMSDETLGGVWALEHLSWAAVYSCRFFAAEPLAISNLLYFFRKQ